MTFLITGPGGVFSTGLTIASVSTGGTAGVAAPANPLAVKVAYS